MSTSYCEKEPVLVGLHRILYRLISMLIRESVYDIWYRKKQCWSSDAIQLSKLYCTMARPLTQIMLLSHRCEWYRRTINCHRYDTQRRNIYQSLNAYQVTLIRRLHFVRKGGRWYSHASRTKSDSPDQYVTAPSKPLLLSDQEKRVLLWPWKFSNLQKGNVCSSLR